MKKIYFLIITMLFSFLLIGCKPSEFEIIKNYIDDVIPSVISEDVELITTYSKFNANIEWESSNEDVIDFAGNIYVKNKAEVVVLTYTITIEDKIMSYSKEVIVSPVDVETIALRFERQFSSIISRDHNLTTSYLNVFKIDWYSTNENVFDNQGHYHKPKIDTEFQIVYKVVAGNYVSEAFYIDLVALGQTDLEKINEITNWLKREQFKDLYLTEDVSLPTYYEPLKVNIKWKSSNQDVVTNEGKVTHYVFERYVTLQAIFDLGTGSGSTVNFECIVSPLDTSKMSEEEVLENFLSAIAMSSYDGVFFGGNGASCNQSYGHLNFYNNKSSEIDVDYIPTNFKNRTQIKQDVKMIVCHDTGNMNRTATAAANANYVRSGYGGSSTGWHYTVGNDGIFQTVPDDEVAYQANGSSNQYTKFIKTNIKAEWQKPNFTVSDDGYIMINDKKSNIKLPDVNEKLASDGPVWQIGNDGYYYIANLWFCESHGYNATQGGNANAIGIESAVNAGSDYALTCRMFAKLVAELLIKHNLDLSRVVQHNTTSGKDCPNAMRVTNYWYTFKDMISLEKFAKENFSEYTFSWNGTGDIDNTGKITLNTKAKEVSYSVIVKQGNDVVLSKDYTTKINN